LSVGVGELKHTVELPNGLSEQEIEAEFQEWKNDHLDQSWWFEEDNNVGKEGRS